MLMQKTHKYSQRNEKMHIRKVIFLCKHFYLMHAGLFIQYLCVYSLQVMDFEGLVSSLNEQGFLLKKGAKLYQLQTV